MAKYKMRIEYEFDCMDDIIARNTTRVMSTVAIEGIKKGFYIEDKSVKTKLQRMVKQDKPVNIPL